ncbi:hypothetical protein B0H13DRAFT_2300919 [Mycena leptocephala]|nr:hypothetical protein B0H13DRAFT_2300919 [Mycena leptocephala]
MTPSHNWFSLNNIPQRDPDDEPDCPPPEASYLEFDLDATHEEADLKDDVDYGLVDLSDSRIVIIQARTVLGLQMLQTATYWLVGSNDMSGIARISSPTTPIWRREYRAEDTDSPFNEAGAHLLTRAYLRCCDFVLDSLVQLRITAGSSGMHSSHDTAQASPPATSATVQHSTPLLLPRLPGPRRRPKQADETTMTSEAPDIVAERRALDLYKPTPGDYSEDTIASMSDLSDTENDCHADEGEDGELSEEGEIQDAKKGNTSVCHLNFCFNIMA